MSLQAERIIKHAPSLASVQAALRLRESKFMSYYPETGPLSRHNYPKHMAWMKASKKYTECCMLGSNRSGKSDCGCYTITAHMTGLYPAWWEGRKFTKPTKWWIAGKTGKTVRDIIQNKLLGKSQQLGTGFIPVDLIHYTTTKHGLADAVETFYVKHVSGGYSEAVFKSYDQGRDAFEGEEIDGGWCDEEPPSDIYAEFRMRTMTTNGLMLLTFIPLLGVTELVKSFLNAAKIPLVDPDVADE